jgi:hypothetical protein
MHDTSGHWLFKKCEFISEKLGLIADYYHHRSLNDAFMVGNNMPMRPPPAHFKTPPYVTALPVVTHRKMSLLPVSGSESTAKRKRFLVLATDGLWDELR